MSRNKVIHGSLMPVAGIVKLDNTNFVGTVEEWNALSHSQRSQYLTADITNDFMYIMYDYNCPAGATSKGGVTPTQTKRYGVDITIENSGFNPPDGYNFVGWNTAPDGSGTDYAAGATYSGNAAMILYAKWEESNDYTVSWSAPLSQYGEYLGDETTESADNAGWKSIVYTNSAGQTAYANPYEAGSITVKNGTSITLRMIAARSGALNHTAWYKLGSRIDYQTGDHAYALLSSTLIITQSSLLSIETDEFFSFDESYTWVVEIHAATSSGYTLSWLSNLSEHGRYLGDGEYIVGTAYEEKAGYKRIRYTDPDGGLAYANPYHADYIYVEPGTKVFFEMVSGYSEMLSSVGWDINLHEETSQGKNYQFIKSPNWEPDSDAVLTITQDDGGSSCIWIVRVQSS